MLRIRGTNTRFQGLSCPDQRLVVVTLCGEPTRFMVASYVRMRGTENPVLLTFASRKLAKRLSADIAAAGERRHLATVSARSAAQNAFDELRMDLVVVHEVDTAQDAWDISYLSRNNCSWVQQ
jgi:hypothetical protein